MPSSSKGLTLIELLVAIAIAVLVVGVVYLVYNTALNMLRAQSVARENLEPAADALDTLQRDLLCALAPRGATNQAFLFTPAGQDNPADFSLHFFTAQPGEGSNDWRLYGIREVEYALRPNGVSGGCALVRQSRPLRIAPPGPPAGVPPEALRVRGATASGVGALLSPRRSALAEPGAAPVPDGPITAPGEILLRSLADLQIQLYNGKEWTNGWQAGANPIALPQAARIALQIELPSGPQTLSSETLIPAGHKITAPAKLGQPLEKTAPPKTNLPVTVRTNAAK